MYSSPRMFTQRLRAQRARWPNSRKYWNTPKAIGYNRTKRNYIISNVLNSSIVVEILWIFFIGSIPTSHVSNILKPKKMDYWIRLIHYDAICMRLYNNVRGMYFSYFSFSTCSVQQHKNTSAEVANFLRKWR